MLNSFSSTFDNSYLASLLSFKAFSIAIVVIWVFIADSSIVELLNVAPMLFEL